MHTKTFEQRESDFYSEIPLPLEVVITVVFTPIAELKCGDKFYIPYGVNLYTYTGKETNLFDAGHYYSDGKKEFKCGDIDIIKQTTL